MALPKKSRGKRRKPLIDTLPELLVSALAESKDLILCFETDVETRKRNIHVMTGQFITPCMLRKLIGQAGPRKDEGSTHTSRPWEPVKHR
jgi:hypothetical protein